MQLMASRCNQDDMEFVLSKCLLGDWFVITLLYKNMENFNFVKFIQELAKRLKHDSDDPLVKKILTEGKDNNDFSYA